MRYRWLLLLLAASVFAAPKPFPWSTYAADSLIARHPDPDAIHWKDDTNHFSWQAGYAMFTLEKLWRLTGDQRYFDYVRKYVDQQVDDQGRIADFKPNALDNFLPGYAILFLYEQTGLEKYKTAATTIHKAFEQYPRNADGSYWHGEWAKHQMWVDGVFMGQIFEARYGAVMKDRAAFDRVTQQMKLALAHCRKENGLLLHGWDESRAASWADKRTGRAAEVWSEGLGWFAVLIADVFDYLPQDHPDRAALLEALRGLCAGLKQVQDPRTGMWSQVVDKQRAAGNWNETSGTGMFLYLIRKAIDKGYIARDEYLPVVRNAYNGIITKAVRGADGRADIVDCSSIGIMVNYEAYVKCPKETNTFAGIASFILGTSAMEVRSAAGPPHEGPEPAFFTPCQILSHLEDFQCRRVQIVSRLISGVDTFLAGENCPASIQVGQVEFQNLLAVQWPSSFAAGCKVEFGDDASSRGRLWTVMGSYDPAKQRIDVLIEGVIETRIPPYALVGKQGQMTGFGHEGMAPAQLIVEKIVNINVRAK